MPDLEKLSSNERRLLADEKRQSLNGAVSLGFMPRPKPSAEVLAQRDRENAARALPDALFAGDPDVQRLRAVYDARKAVGANHLAIQHWLMGEQVRQAARVEAARDALMWAVLFDATAQDGNFPRARAAIAAVQAEQELADGIQAAGGLVNANPGTATQLGEAEAQALAALQNRLFELKLAHIDAQAVKRKVM